MTCMSIPNCNLSILRHSWWSSLITLFKVIYLKYASFCLLNMLVADILFNNITASRVLIINRVLSTWFCVIWLVYGCHATLDVLVRMVVFLDLFCDAGSTHETFVVLVFGVTLVHVFPLEILTSSQRSTALEMRWRRRPVAHYILVKSSTSRFSRSTWLILINSLLPPPMLHRVLLLSILVKSWISIQRSCPISTKYPLIQWDILLIGRILVRNLNDSVLSVTFNAAFLLVLIPKKSNYFQIKINHLKLNNFNIYWWINTYIVVKP